MSVAIRLPLQVFFDREARRPRQRFLVQPIKGGEVQTLTWAEAGHQARCAAHWLRARDLPQGSHIALISKNCAHWIIADLAIWMAGHVSAPSTPTSPPTPSPTYSSIPKPHWHLSANWTTGPPCPPE